MRPKHVEANRARIKLHPLQLNLNSFLKMVSAVDRCKRALVSLLRTLAGLYGCRVTVTRDSPDNVVKRAYRTLSKKVHPDRGGNTEDQSKLNSKYEARLFACASCLGSPAVGPLLLPACWAQDSARSVHTRCDLRDVADYL